MWFWWPPIPGKLGFKTLWFLVTSVSPSLPVIDGRVKSISSIRTLTSIWVWSGFQRICWPQIKYFEKGWKEIGPWWQNRDSWVYCALVRTTITTITRTSNYIISIPTDDLLIGSSQHQVQDGSSTGENVSEGNSKLWYWTLNIRVTWCSLTPDHLVNMGLTIRKRVDHN